MKAIIVCSTDTELQGAPEKVKLLPLGTVNSEKGDFTVDADSFAAMKKEFERRGIDIVIDYEHQTLKDVQAPAGGWIKELCMEEDAIVAKVEWTPQAKKYLDDREYRYLSPVVIVDNAMRRAKALHSVALTNTPAINGMFPIINSIGLDGYEDGADKEGGSQMDLLKQLIALLGLGEDSTEQDVISVMGGVLEESKQLKDSAGDGEKIVSNKVVCGLLGLEPGAKTEDAAAAIVALSNKKPEGYVSEAEFLALKNKVARQEAEEAVEKAMKAGKLAAAQKEWAIGYAVDNPEGFAAFVLKAPAIVPMGEVLPNDEKPSGHSAKADEDTRLICKQLGIPPEELDEYLKAQGKDEA